MSWQSMNWNILDASFTPALFLQSLFYHTERNDNCSFCAWGSFWVPTHIFIQHLVFMAVFDWILGWCQFTPPGVPIHPSCANSPRPVVNFIFFNKTKTEVPEVLKMFMRRALCIALTHICYNLLAVSMTSLEAIKKRGANSPRSPLQRSLLFLFKIEPVGEPIGGR